MSDDIDAAFAAADVQVLNQDVSAAFERLIAIGRVGHLEKSAPGCAPG
ncbi:thioredoxin [Mycobacterium tuberculosis RGTB327]|nr:thioredoxin [Mycobacterium tuberculosis RGTB327]